MFGIDTRIIYIILIVGLLFSLVSMGGEGLLGLLLTLPGVIIAITFHEYAHAFTADRLGDDTPRRQGRLNLNTFTHMDPIGFIMLIVAHFGWGKPVQINPLNFNSKYTLAAGEAIVSIAGPIMNFILAIVFAIITFAVTTFAGASFLATTVGEMIITILQYTVIVNIGLGVFNLIPLPPLDGSKVLNYFLPYNARAWFESKTNLFYVVFLLLWITGIAGKIISPIIDGIYSGIIWIMVKLFGLF